MSAESSAVVGIDDHQRVAYVMPVHSHYLLGQQLQLLSFELTCAFWDGVHAMLVAANASPAIIPFLRVTSFSALHHSRSRVLPSPTSACRWSSTISSPREEVQEVSNSFAVGESLRKKQDGDNGLPKSVKKSTSPAAVSSGLDSSSDPSGGEGPKGKKAKSHFASHFDLNDARVKYPKKKRKTTQLARDDEGRPYSKPALGAHNEVHLLKRSINEGDRPATVLKKRKKSRPDVDAQTIKELIKVEGWQLDNWRDEWKMERKFNVCFL